MFDEITNVLLDDPKIEVRQAAAKALGSTLHPAAVPCLMEALRDSFWWYEREAQAGDLFTAIEKMGEAAVESLIEALKENEGAVRKYAALVLGRIGDARAIEPLGMALYDLHHDVGKVSAEALARFGVPSFEILVEALDHPEIWIRIHSVDVLPKISEPRVALVLLEMLKDPEREVKKHVIEALGELKDPRTLGWASNVFTHDHFGPSTHQQAGLYATLLVEPEGSTWRLPETGTFFGGRSDGGPTSWRADIITEDPNESYREFYLEFADFQLAYRGNDGKDNPAGTPVNPSDRKEVGLPFILGSNNPIRPEAISAADPGTVCGQLPERAPGPEGS